ncbi:MAG: AMP-binding protein, partial [Myxococcaceae bacterium]|nr:AMP-binding protein [Myxococcaceae bacterium]
MRTVLDAVLEHATQRPAEPCFDLVSLRAEEQRRTWREVAEGAARAAGFFAGQGVGRGDTVVLIGTHHVDFVACWLGAVWVGAAPCVLAEPSVRVDREVYWSRLEALLTRIGAKVVVTAPAVEAKVVASTYTAAASYAGAAVAKVDAAEHDLLLLQHSSGTTGLQKGVMLSHGAVMRHAASYGRALALQPGDRVASWLPLYHDMGLIACFVTPLIAGVPVTWLSPFEWVAQPASLLAAIDRYRATHVWLPNFAYGFLAQRVRGGTWDLSCIKAVINCSEPVTAEAIDAFSARFGGNGLAASAVHACYAMAENVFAVTTTSPAQPIRRRTVALEAWQTRHEAVEAADGVTHVSSGVPVEGCEVQIVAVDSARRIGVGHGGRVLIRSPFLFDGYFRRDDLNAGLFGADGFYDTGDLGYLDEAGHLY